MNSTTLHCSNFNTIYRFCGCHAVTWSKHVNNAGFSRISIVELFVAVDALISIFIYAPCLCQMFSGV